MVLYIKGCRVEQTTPWYQCASVDLFFSMLETWRFDVSLLLHWTNSRIDRGLREHDAQVASL